MIDSTQQDYSLPVMFVSSSHSARLTLACILSTSIIFFPLRQLFAASPEDGQQAVSLEPEKMWVQTFPLDDSRHVLLIVDPILRNVAIYHVDTVAGTLTLKSSRDISQDLRMGDFNAQEPKPETLRNMLNMGSPSPFIKQERQIR